VSVHAKLMPCGKLFVVLLDYQGVTTYFLTFPEFLTEDLTIDLHELILWRIEDFDRWWDDVTTVGSQGGDECGAYYKCNNKPEECREEMHDFLLKILKLEKKEVIDK